MNVVIAGGGSGGHLFPGIAVAEEFLRRDPSAKVSFVGTEKGIESTVIPKEGYTLRLLRTEAFLGRSPLGMLASLYRTFTAMLGCMEHYKDLAPDLVVGTGGYASVAPVLAARLRGIPTVLLEQNVAPGLANRMLARVADRIAITYHEGLAELPRLKTHITGNPVRQSILRGDREKALEIFQLESDRLTVFIFGGSSGARRINESMITALHGMLDIREKVQFLHQTGQSDYERVRKIYREMGFTAMVAPFIHQMPEAYALADIVVARSGATTLAEITALGKPLILIPYPYAAAHQELNARKLEDMGGCILIRDHELSGDTLRKNIRKLFDSEDLRGEMRRQCRALGRADAAQRVVDLCMNLLKQRGAYV